MKNFQWSVTYVLGYLLCHVMAVYNPVREHSGQTFFDGWSYYGNVDNTTWGNVTFQDQANATSRGLTFVNSAGNAVIKVDNTTTISPAPIVNRDSIRLTSLDSYGLGSLFIIDAVHIPYGCSVWPSFWMYGMEDTWPLAGEIDIIEAINGMTNNQVALHTTPGCFQATNALQTGHTIETNCSKAQGCIVGESKPNSFGPGFAQAGGGVYALVMEPTGVSSWFWSRADIPDDIASATSSSTMDPSSWGTPSASYPSSACDFEQFFPPQNLVLLTTLCGHWAGVPSIYRSTCNTPTNSCINDNIFGNGSNYANAYWEIRYIRTYLNASLAATTTTSASTSPTVDPATSDKAQPTKAPSNRTSSALQGVESPVFIGIVSSIIAVLFTSALAMTTW